MRQLVAIFLSVAVIAGEVSAQGFSPYPQDQATILTEAQKRRMLLPYVRALTDCFAREIAGNQSAFLHAQQNRWYDALVTTGTACEPFLSTMVREHDRLHGLGTGSAFFKGAYIQDLPRALNVRLKSEMEKRAVEAARIEAAKKAELARQEAERKIQIDHAERAFNLLRQKMYECTTGQLAGLVSSSETAEVLATAAMTVCAEEVHRAIESGIARMKAEFPDIGNIRDEFRSGIRTEVVTNAVQIRALANTTLKPSAHPSRGAMAPSSSAEFQSTDECLKTAISGRDEKLAHEEKLIQTMLDLCRPEIESAARKAFLADSSTSLDQHRAAALNSALKRAQTIVVSNP